MVQNLPKKSIKTLSLEYEKRGILQLFSEYLVDTFQFNDSSVLEELDDELIDLLDNDSNFKKEFEDTLYANQEIITSQDFILAGKRQQPTVANWLKEFIKAGVIDQGLDFDQVKYFNQSKNFNNLSLTEKDLVAKLFDLYYRVKFYPESFNKLPINDRHVIPFSTIKETKIQRLKAKEKPPITTVKKDLNQELVDIYYQTLNKFTHLNEEKIVLAEMTDNQPTKITTELIRAFKTRNLVKVLASLELLAENNNLDLLKKEAKLASGFKRFISRQMKAAEFKIFWGQDFNLKYLRLYLKWLLMDGLGQPENDSAVFALKLANTLRRKGDDSFMKIAYGDSQSQSFKWQEEK